ncbi:hypothetical protein QUF74_09110 [Candidatus Halobeggiatoa sp. HSG11]|nr:hypothetical protein [Candidatus Halobeggiatoa sp. HSG11]
MNGMDNFYKTALRTSKSSKTLHDNSEYFNACYLGGYVVECYSKILLKYAYSLTNEDLKKEFKHDLKRTTREIEILRQDQTISDLINPAYLIDLNNICNIIITGQNKWDPIKRYYNDETIWNDDTSIQYQHAINIVMDQISLMKIDGIIQ